MQRHREAPGTDVLRKKEEEEENDMRCWSGKRKKPAKEGVGVSYIYKTL